MAHNNDLRLAFRYIRAQAFRNKGATIMNRTLSSFVGALRSRAGRLRLGESSVLGARYRGGCDVHHDSPEGRAGRERAGGSASASL
jgi:hypothetical protein